MDGEKNFRYQTADAFQAFGNPTIQEAHNASFGGQLPEFFIDDWDQPTTDSPALINHEQNTLSNLTGDTQLCGVGFPTCTNDDYLARTRGCQSSITELDNSPNNVAYRVLRSTPPHPTTNGISTPTRASGPEVFVNIQKLAQDPSEADKAYSPTTLLDLEDIMEVLAKHMPGDDKANSKVWNNPTVTVDHVCKDKANEGQYGSGGALTKSFQADSPAMKNSEVNTRAPSVNTPIPHANEGSHTRKRANDQDKAFTESCLYEKKLKTQAANPLDNTTYTSPTNTIVYAVEERLSTSNASPFQNGSQSNVGILSASSRNLASVSRQHLQLVQNYETASTSVPQHTPHLVSSAEPDQLVKTAFQSSFASTFTANPAPSYGLRHGAATIPERQVYGDPSPGPLSNNTLQQSSHFCTRALDHASGVMQNRHPCHQPSTVPTVQQQVPHPTVYSGFEANVTAPQSGMAAQGKRLLSLEQVYQTVGDAYSASSSSLSAMVGSVQPFQRNDSEVAAQPSPVDPTRLGVVSHMGAQSSSNQRRLAPGDIKENEIELRMKSFSRDPLLLMKCHKMIGSLAKCGFFLTWRSMIHCADESCKMMHLLPNVLDKNSSEVSWHKSGCRFFFAKNPCKYCVGERIECAKCGQSSQAADRAF